MTDQANRLNSLLALSRESRTQTRDITREAIEKAPFGWHGGKYRSVPHLMQHLPHRRRYVEVFGGSGVTLINRIPSEIEVFNDRFSGVTDFYIVLKDEKLLDRLEETLDLMLTSREMFNFCRDTWDGTNDIVERAARWYYMIVLSFGGQGRNYGRGLNQTKTVFSRFELLRKVHNRIRNVQIENQSWETLLPDWDSKDTVFYCDPPYLPETITTKGYKHNMERADHIHLLDQVFKMEGFVAVSGYENDLYRAYPWDDVVTWKVCVSAKAMAFTESNNQIEDENEREREQRTETLYIKHQR